MLKNFISYDYFKDAITLEDIPFCFKERYLEGKKYIKRYMKLPMEVKQSTWNSQPSIKITLQKEPHIDFIENVDLFLPKEAFNDLESIQLEVGGQRFDKIYFKERSMEFLYDLYNRPIEECPGDKIKVPLHMCTITNNNLLAVSSGYYHEIVFLLNFNNYTDQSDIDIWSNVYTMDEKEKYMVYNMITQQTQFTGEELINKNGTNKVRLNFNHPMHSIYIYGTVLPYVKNVKLILNDLEWYNGPLYNLYTNNKKYARFLMLEKEKITDEYKKGLFINFSRIDVAILELEIENMPEEDHFLCIYGHSFQILTHMQGMYGLRYSK